MCGQVVGDDSSIRRPEKFSSVQKSPVLSLSRLSRSKKIFINEFNIHIIVEESFFCTCIFTRYKIDDDDASKIFSPTKVTLTSDERFVYKIVFNPN